MPCFHRILLLAFQSFSCFVRFPCTPSHLETFESSLLRRCVHLHGGYGCVVEIRFCESYFPPNCPPLVLGFFLYDSLGSPILVQTLVTQVDYNVLQQHQNILCSIIVCCFLCRVCLPLAYCGDFAFHLQLDYEKCMKAYHNSPAYLAYLSAKSRGKPGMLLTSC